MIYFRKAYFRLAKEHHPDVRKKDNEDKQFEMVNEAYHTLKHPKTRKLYDRTGLSLDDQKAAGSYTSSYGDRIKTAIDKDEDEIK
jgi:DnaJ-class molecular chaperone